MAAAFDHMIDGPEGTVTATESEPDLARVTISTELPIRRGMIGVIERAMVRRYLRKVYVAELARLDEQVRI